MKKTIVFIICLLVNSNLIRSQELISISNLHQNNEAGLITQTEAVQISGTVTSSGTSLSARQINEYFVQDATAGVLVLCDESFQIGDRLEVTGLPAQVQGMTALEASSINYVGTETLPEPLTVTCSDIREAFLTDFSEPNEGRLVQIAEVNSRNTEPYFTLFDDTGLCKLYLDPALNVPEPSDKFSIVGILVQRDGSTPFTEDYLIMPRTSEDIIYPGAPKIIVQPRESDIQSYEVTIGWETSNLSSSVMEFGQTTNYEMGRVGDSTRIQAHQLTIKNLEPATIYHCRAISTNDNGTVVSRDLLFSTASHAESQGIINVWFNKTVDTAVAYPEPANGLTNMGNQIVSRINAAQHSVDVCIYALTLDNITTALKNAKNKGVSVRVITENDYRNNNIASLVQAGIPVIDDMFGEGNGYGYMHNKFVICDARDNSSAADDWVWTGSANFSYNGSTRNAENCVEIQDEALAQCYTMEFNEMWGNATETPDSTTSRFSSQKTDNTPHVFNINGIMVEQYMSPGDHVMEQIYQKVESAHKSIRFCIYSFTVEALVSRMQQQRDKITNLVFSGVFDSGQRSGDVYKAFTEDWDPPADVWLWEESYLMHSKYLIVDVEQWNSDPLVATGSYNWSSSAESRNDENLIIFHDQSIANLYYQDFRARYKEAGGTASVPAEPELKALMTLNPNYPNPFNSSTTISYSLNRASKVTLRIYNVQGRHIQTLQEKEQSAGTHRLVWNGRDLDQNPVSSGIYYIRIESRNFSQVQKMVMIK